MTETPQKALGVSGGSMIALGLGVWIGYKAEPIEWVEAKFGKYGTTGLGVGYFALAIALYYIKKYLGVGGTGIIDLIFSFLMGFAIGLGIAVFSPPGE